MKAKLAAVLASAGVLINDVASLWSEVFFRLSDLVDPPAPTTPLVHVPRVRKVRMGLSSLTLEAQQEDEFTIVAQRPFRPRHLVLTGANGTPGKDPLAAVALVYLRVNDDVLVDKSRPLPASVFSPEMQGTSFEWPPVLTGTKLTFRFSNLGQQPVTVLGTLCGTQLAGDVYEV